MKQGTNSIMRINIDIDFDTVERIEFLFEQDEERVVFSYPSDKAIKVEGENAIDLVWSAADTYYFNSKKYINMDTRIHLIDVETNPETSIAQFYMSPTLFRKGD